MFKPNQSRIAATGDCTAAREPARARLKRSICIDLDGGRRAAARLARDGPRARVECAMRYGAPSIRARPQQLQREGIERVLLLPMYQQYSAAATASAFDATFDACKYMRDLPEIRTIRHYADFPPYIAACAQRIRGDWSMHSRPDFAAGDKLLLSFHGLPQAMIERGDP